MKKFISFIAIIAVFFMTANAQKTYSLVTDLSTIVDGQTIIIVGTDDSNNYFAIGNQKSGGPTGNISLTNRYSIAVTNNAGQISLTPCASDEDVVSVCEFTITSSNSNYLFYDVVNEGFLSPRTDDNSKNGLVHSPSAMEWTITMANNGLSSIVANTNLTDRTRMRHNYNSNLFASYLETYSTDVTDLYIFASSEVVSDPVITITSPTNNAIIQTSNVVVNFSVQNFVLGTDGNLLYNLSLNDIETDVDFGEILDPATTTIEFNNLEDGEYQLLLYLTDGDNSKAIIYSTELFFTVFTDIAEETTYTLVTNVNQLQHGKKCIIVGKTASNVYYAMGKQNNNSRAAINVTSNLNNNQITVTPAILASEENKVFEITIEGNDAAWIFHDETNSTLPYLAPKNSDSNGMPGSSSPVTWNITIAADGLATVVATDQTTYPRPDMRFNENTTNPPSVFSCYKTTQTSEEITHVYLYMSDATPSTEPSLAITAPANNATLYTSSVNVEATIANFVLGTDGKIKYVVDGADPEFTTTTTIQLTLEDGNHTVELELVDMSENSFSAPVTASVSFTINLSGPAITAIHDIQYTTASNGDSPLNGQIVWVEGIVTFIQYKEGGSNDGQVEGYYIQDDIAPWSGIYVYDNVNTVQLGNTVKIQGKVSEYYSLTEITNVSSFEITDIETVVPEPMLISAADAMTEAYEGCYVAVSCFTIVSSEAYGNFTVTDNTTTFTVNKTHQLHLANQYLQIDASYYGYGVVNYRDMMRIMLAAVEEREDCSQSSVNSNLFENTTIYPNPVTNELYINTDQNIKNISIINSIGQVVIELENIENNQVINTNSLNSGLYIIKYSDGNYSKIDKFIKE